PSPRYQSGVFRAASQRRNAGMRTWVAWMGGRGRQSPERVLPMSATTLRTKSLDLILLTREAVIAAIEAMNPSDQAQVSAAYLALLNASTLADPWVHGFSIVHRDSGAAIGRCGFKAPPDAE